MAIITFPPPAAKGLIRHTNALADSPLTTSTSERMAYTWTFPAEAGRAYRISLFASQADGDATGGDPTTRVAKQSIRTRCRWATGTTVTTTSNDLGAIRTSIFNSASDTGTGVDANWILNNPPAGNITIGISIQAVRAPTSYGHVNLLTDDGGRLSIEDIGPAL